MARIRWAVMGAGGIARRRTIPEGILPAANAELVAVYAPHTGRKVAAEFGVACAETEQSLLDFDFDALYIASPVNCHARQAIAAAAAGKHVLCEKPLALDVADAERMLAACDRAGVVFGVGLMMRFHPHHQRAAEIVRNGDIGVPVYAQAQLSCWYPPLPNAWRQDPLQGGGGAVPDLATHCIDILEMILGEQVKSVSCQLARRVHSYPVEDTAVLLLEFVSGTLATVDCLFNVPDQSVRNRFEVYGSQGSLLAEGTLGQSQSGAMQWFQTPCESTYDAQQGRLSDPLDELLPLAPGNLYRSQIEEFGAAIDEQRQPLAAGRQGVWIQRVLATCQQAAAEGRTLEIRPTDRPGIS